MHFRCACARLLSTVIVLTAVAGVATPPIEGAERYFDQLLGKLNDLNLVRFTGNSTFTADAIRAALRNDTDVMAAGHPDSQVKDYVAALKSSITGRYRYAGFHEADVAVDFVKRDRRFDIVIREGKRYRFGEVKVTGNTRVPTKEIVSWLTEPKPDTTQENFHDPDVSETAPPVWLTVKKQGGAPAPIGGWTPALLKKPRWQPNEVGKFSGELTKEVERLTTAAYLEAGRTQPTFTVRTAARESTVDLLVDITSEGTANLIGDIELVGLKRNGRAELLKLIDLPGGATYDRALRSRIERALWRSARFRAYSVTYYPGAVSTGPLSTATGGSAAAPATDNALWFHGITKSSMLPFGKLRVEVDESRASPKLGADFTPLQQAALKHRAWLAASGERGDEFAFRAGRKDDWSLELIASPGSGWLAEWSLKSNKLGTARRTYGIRSSDESLGFYAFDRGLKLEAKPTAFTFNFATGVNIASDERQTPSFAANAGVQQAHQGQRGPTIQLRNRISPAAAVACAVPAAQSGDGNDCRLVDGTLIFDQNIRLKVDAATGKLLGAEVRPPESYQGGKHEGPDAFGNLFGADRVELQVGRGLLAAKTKAWRAKTDALRNTYDDKQPIASTLNFLIDDPLWNAFDDDGEKSVNLKKTFGFLRKFRDSELAGPILEVYESAFAVNDDATRFSGETDNSIARLADVSFPEKSWPWLQTRAFALALTKGARHTPTTLERSAADDAWGPLAFGCAAAGAKKLEYGPLAEQFSSQGMKLLALADFERDCKPLVDPKHLSGRLLHGTARFIRSLDDDEAAALIRFTGGDALWAGHCVLELRDDPKRPLEEVLPRALRKTWSREAQSRLAGLMSRWIK